MNVDLAILLTPLSTEDCKRSIYAVLGNIGASTTTWKPGAVVRTIITAVAIILAGLTQLVALIASSGFLALASGVWLTLVARYVFGIEREPATFGTGKLQLVNAGGSSFTLDPGEFVAKNLDTKKTYTNVATFTLDPNSSLVIDVIAQEVGSASTSTVGAITGFGTPLLNVTCVNTTAVVGLDDEKDPDLFVRCTDKLGSLSPNGPADAYAFVLRGCKRADGTPIGINRVSKPQPDGYGNIRMWVSTASGGVPGVTTDANTDLGTAYLAILSQATPLCVVPFLFSAPALPVNITYTVYSYNVAGLTSADIVAKIAIALGQLFARLPIGGHELIAGIGLVYVDEIKGAMQTAVPSIFHVVFANLPDDVSVPAGYTPTLGVLTGSAVLSARTSI